MKLGGCLSPTVLQPAFLRTFALTIRSAWKCIPSDMHEAHFFLPLYKCHHLDETKPCHHMPIITFYNEMQPMSRVYCLLSLMKTKGIAESRCNEKCSLQNLFTFDVLNVLWCCTMLPTAKSSVQIVAIC